MPKPPGYWLRKHLKGTAVQIACQACPTHTVHYSCINGRDTCNRTCMGKDKYTGVTLNKSLDYWPYSNSPGWCPRRKANGGEL